MSDIKTYIAHYINTSSTIQTKSTKIKNKDEAIISFINEKSLTLTGSILKQKYNTNFKIERGSIKNPKIKITGFDNFEGMEIEEIEQDINKRNFKYLNSICKVLHIFENTKTKINTILIKTTAKVYNQIVKNKYRVHIGYQNCRASDDLNLISYCNCGRFGHSGKKCRNPKICLNCAGKHSTKNYPRRAQLHKLHLQ